MSLFRFLKGAKPTAAASSGFLGLWAGADNRLYVTDEAGIDAPVDGRLISQTLSAATTLSAAHHARLLTCTGTWSLTIPAAAGLSGLSCRLANIGSGIIALSGGVTQNLTAGKALDLTCDGTQWVMSGRDGQDGIGGVVWCSTVGGTANAITLTPAAAVGAYVAGLSVAFAPSAANTGAVTLNISALGVKSAVRADGGALAVGDLLSSRQVLFVYDGTSFRLQGGAPLTASSNGYGARTVSVSTPSGGADGDIWYKV